MWRPARMSRLFALVALCICAGMTPLTAGAVDWENLVMPGPVISGHAEIEKAVQASATRRSRGDEQRQLCLDCHDKIAADINTKVGFHWRFEPARTGQCRNCHTDHEGPRRGHRAPDTADLQSRPDRLRAGGRRTRDSPAPAATRRKRKHRDAPATCIGCHAEDDFHKKALGEDCATCHGVASWKETTFDHAKATENRYPLTGAHEKVECGLCHAGQRYKDTPTACVACHRIDDVHQGQRGTDCENCHDTGAWKEHHIRPPEEDRLCADGWPCRSRLPGLSYRQRLQEDGGQGMRRLPPQRRHAPGPQRAGVQGLPHDESLERDRSSITPRKPNSR